MGEQRDNGSRWFERGYVCAAAEIIRTHGEDVIARDVLRGIGLIDWDDIDEGDRDALKEVRRDLERGL
jgi:hypothetical protein